MSLAFQRHGLQVISIERLCRLATPILPTHLLWSRCADLRVAESRTVNRALRKAYGIGLCLVDELG